MYLGRLQNLLRAVRASDVRACPHLAPFSERARHTNLRPNSHDQRHADVEEPVRAEAETGWIIHIEFKFSAAKPLVTPPQGN